MIRYQYKVLRFCNKTDSPPESDAFQPSLDEHGAEGWEIASTAISTANDEFYCVVLVFLKREIPAGMPYRG